MIRIGFRFIIGAALLAGILGIAGRRAGGAQVVPTRPCKISWEVRNRFSAFREGARFPASCRQRQSAQFSPPEQALELQSGRPRLGRKMVSPFSASICRRVSEPCNRDNVKESYLTPNGACGSLVRLTGRVPVGAPPVHG